MAKAGAKKAAKAKPTLRNVTVTPVKKEPSGPIANPTKRGPAADMNAVYNAAVKTAFDTILQHEKFADLLG